MGKKSRRKRFCGLDDIIGVISESYRKAKSFNDCVRLLLSPLDKYVTMVNLGLVEQEVLDRYKSCADKAKKTLLNLIESKGFLCELDGADMQALAFFNELLLLAREIDAGFTAGKTLDFGQIMRLHLLHDIICSFASNQLLGEYVGMMREEGVPVDVQALDINPSEMMYCQREILDSLYKALCERKDSGIVVDEAEVELHDLFEDLTLRYAQDFDLVSKASERGELSEDKKFSNEFFHAYFWQSIEDCRPMGQKLAARLGELEQRSGRSLRADPPGATPLKIFL